MKSIANTYNQLYEYALSRGWDEKEAAKFAYAKMVEVKPWTKTKPVENERLEGL